MVSRKCQLGGEPGVKPGCWVGCWHSETAVRMGTRLRDAVPPRGDVGGHLGV